VLWDVVVGASKPGQGGPRNRPEGVPALHPAIKRPSGLPEDDPGSGFRTKRLGCSAYGHAQNPCLRLRGDRTPMGGGLRGVK